MQTLKLQELLEEAGYRAYACSNGASAVRKTEELRPDLVLLDLEMPGMGGVEACQIIKSTKGLAHIPVLILTGHDNPKNLVAAFDAGCAGYIAKGTPDVQLLDKIKRHAPLHNFIYLRRAE